VAAHNRLPWRPSPTSPMPKLPDTLPGEVSTVADNLSVPLLHLLTVPPYGRPIHGEMTVYQKPSCSTCRQVLTILREAKAKFETIDYTATPMSATTLRRLIKKLGRLSSRPTAHERRALQEARIGQERRER